MNQQPVYTFAKWQVKEGQLSTVLSLLTEMAEQSTQEEGNLFYKVHQGNLDANTLILFEGYANEAAVEVHRNTAYFQKIVLAEIIPLLAHREVTLVSQLELIAQ